LEQSFTACMPLLRATTITATATTVAQFYGSLDFVWDYPGELVPKQGTTSAS